MVPNPKSGSASSAALRFEPSCAYGAISVVLALYLAQLGLSEPQIGLVLTCTLVGDAVISLGIVTLADRLGRRRMLFLGAGLMIVAGLVFALTRNVLVLTLAAR